MSESVAIGQLRETLGELEVEWKIDDFLLLPEKLDEYHNSPKFYFSGTSFYLRVYPNGVSQHNSEGWIGLFVMRGDSGPPVSVVSTLYVNTADGGKEQRISNSYESEKKGVGWGATEFLSRSDLLNRKSHLLPSVILTVTCYLKHDNPRDAKVALHGRQQDVIDNLKKILIEKKRSDVVLQVKGRKFQAHRLILESQSPVFGAMFEHDMAESRTGVVNIDDIHPDAFREVLTYAYCGDIETSLIFENVFDVYAAAEKYDFRKLKTLCKTFIDANLSEDWVCDVIKFADLYKEEETGRLAREYFKNNLKKILETDSWKEFSKVNLEFSMELIASAIKERL